MRTIAPIGVVLALGVAGMMVGMSGFTAAWGAPAPQTTAAQDEINGSSGEVAPGEDPIAGPVSSEDSSTVGLIADGLSTVTNIAGGVAVLPVTLINLGFPRWFALPIGSLASAIAGIGIIQFAVNRVWK